MTMTRILLFIGCGGIAMTGCADARKKSPSGVEFVLVDKRHLKFRITNHTMRTVELDSMFIDPDHYPYSPACPTVQYLSPRGRWVKTQNLSGDGMIFKYPLKPEKSVQFKLDPLLVGDDVKKETLLRLENGNLHSEPFWW